MSVSPAKVEPIWHATDTYNKIDGAKRLRRVRKLQPTRVVHMLHDVGPSFNQGYVILRVGDRTMHDYALGRRRSPLLPQLQLTRLFP